MSSAFAALMMLAVIATLVAWAYARTTSPHPRQHAGHPRWHHGTRTPTERDRAP